MTEKIDNLINLINLLLLINQIAISLSAYSCKISVPDTVTSQKLNNIICIGASGFTYPNFAAFLLRFGKIFDILQYTSTKQVPFTACFVLFCTLSTGMQSTKKIDISK